MRKLPPDWFMSADLCCWRPQPNSAPAGKPVQGWGWWGWGWGWPPGRRERPPHEILLWSSCGSTESERAGKTPVCLSLDKNSRWFQILSPDNGSRCGTVWKKVHQQWKEVLAANAGSNTLILMINITNSGNWYPFTLLSKQLRLFYHSETLQLEEAALKLGGTIW